MQMNGDERPSNIDVVWEGIKVFCWILLIIVVGVFSHLIKSPTLNWLSGALIIVLYFTYIRQDLKKLRETLRDYNAL